jgi:hypothetical protein
MDAARHAYLACLLHQDPKTRDEAKKILDAHENRPTDSCESHEQDLNNNEIGRQLASQGDCSKAALDALNGGRLQVNKPYSPNQCTWTGKK